VKAKPALHKKTFLKPLHKTTEFCSVCHKVHLPGAVTHYKDFLRGQNHYDSFLLSGVSGHGARSFYYPPKAQTNCNGCHMHLKTSNDFGARRFDGGDSLKIHDHLFPSANTAIAWFRNRDFLIEAHRKFNEGVMRVDIFGIKEGGVINGTLHAPLRPEVPVLKPGETYLLETVIRTLKMGHHFTQGTVDSNEIWLDVTITSGEKVIGRSGALDETNGNEVDPWSHFVNVFMLDRNGNRINRRNAQDIVVPLYNHQIPPGAGQTVHYRLTLPDDLAAPVTVNVKLQYRKFDTTYMEIVARNGKPGGKPIRGFQPGEPYRNNLPIMTLAEDSITFPVEGVDRNPGPQQPHIQETWQRWNDYGIGSLLKGKAELRQAADAFQQVERLGRYDGPLNLARVLFREAGEGQLNEAVEALKRASQFKDPPAPSWTMNWLSGLINTQQGRLKEAEANFRAVLNTKVPDRNFDFSRDYEIINLLGETLFERAKQQRGKAKESARNTLLSKAVEQFQKTLVIDSENVTAHYNLSLLYGLLGDERKAAAHRQKHETFKPDDTARGRAVGLARQKYPAANAASEALVIYDLQRPDAPGLAVSVEKGFKNHSGGEE
ncbi:MAG: tetratricopeptide repeat protein, partial [Planctomycetes bacterium]|nr:tetratricopeptide repeat protein [Planctomycetota bacterium]